MFELLVLFCLIIFVTWFAFRINSQKIEINSLIKDINVLVNNNLGCGLNLDSISKTNVHNKQEQKNDYIG